MHSHTYRSYHEGRNNSHEPQLQRAEAPRAAEIQLRERERPAAPAAASATESKPADTTGLSGAELVAHQNREMDRAVRRQRRINAKTRRTGTDWRARADSRRSGPRIPLPVPPPIYYPAPFAQLPVVPYPRETLESALIRVDKVPKSPGFGKEISRIRGQLAKYNFVARRQLEVAERELAGKLEERLKLFPALPKRHADGSIVDPIDPFAPQLHPYDHSLVELSLPQGGGSKQYLTLLNHCRNLVQKLRGAARKGLSGLNHSRNMADSRLAHTTAIRRMRHLWAKGDPAGMQGVDGGSGQRSGMELVEELRLLSRQLRHIPTVDFDRNLLDVKRHPASYLSVLPADFFSLPSSALTFERLRPYLPPSPSYTFSLVGAPNVGKSSLLAALSQAKVEVGAFAFTTKAIQVGHMERGEGDTPSMNRAEAPSTSSASERKRARFVARGLYPQPEYTPSIPLTKVQLVDTPGLLFRPDAMRKPVERQTLALCEHVQPLILGFVVDPSGTSGTSARVQGYLARELYARFEEVRAPHARADDTDPRNHAPFDPLYANVAAHGELQALQGQLRRIPWMTIRTKSDIRKRDRVSEDVLARDTSGAERELRIVEREIRGEAAEVEAEGEAEEDVEEDEEYVDEDAEEEDESEWQASEDVAEEEGDESATPDNNTSSSTDLAVVAPSDALTTVPPPRRPRMDRATWKLQAMREHVRRYLSDEHGNIRLDEEEELGAQRNQLPASFAADASATASTSSSGRLSYSRPSLSSLPCISVSVESGAGLAELEAHIWFEVDRRESLRLERAYKEMKARIQWIRGEQATHNTHMRIHSSQQQEQQQLHASAEHAHSAHEF